MTVEGTLNERYLNWLISRVEPVTNFNPARSHWLMCSELDRFEFTWFIPNDDNRLYDGLDLRQEFIDESEGGNVPGAWLSQPCSFLEMIIALARRLAFESSPLETDYWFWRMMENLDLRRYIDESFDDDARFTVQDAVGRVIERQYNADGRGGLFPLNHPGKDQREVEIWYQSQQYLMENIDV